MQNLDSKGVTGRSRRFQLFVERASHAVFLQLRENASRGSESRWIMRLGCEIACKAGAEKISQAFGHGWRILARQVEAGGSPLFARKKRRMASARLGQVKGGATRQILCLFAYRIHCARAEGNYLQIGLRLFGSACRMRGIGIMSPYFPVSHSPGTRCAEVYAATSAAASEKLTIVCFS